MRVGGRLEHRAAELSRWSEPHSPTARTTSCHSKFERVVLICADSELHFPVAVNVIGGDKIGEPDTPAFSYSSVPDRRNQTHAERVVEPAIACDGGID